MKFSIVQKNIDRNYLEILEDLDESESDIVLFGELSVTGCLYNGIEKRKLLTVTEIQESLHQCPYTVMLGTARIEKQNVYNSYLCFDKSNIQIYDKINLFEPMNELTHFKAGSKPTLFKVGSHKIGVSICYDIRFPELYDTLHELGADLIIIPAAFPRARISDWKSLLIERAKQTGLTVIGINSVGNDGTNEFGGSSMVIASDGSIIAQADEINETIIEVEL